MEGKQNKGELAFYGGSGISLLPLLVFLTVALYFVFSGVADVKGMWLGAVAGLMGTLFFARNKDLYAETVIDGMADRLALIPVACWLFAGIFAGIMRVSGLVEGIIWAAECFGAGGVYFVLISFLASALFATATGTGLGTIIAGMAVLYPAGVMLGADPTLLAGCILGGGALGDNLAPISDTTICSAATQTADIGGVVKSRLRYTLVAAGLTIIIIFLKGNNSTVINDKILTTNMEALGLIMLFPAGLTIAMALKGFHIIVAVTYGSIFALITAHIFGLGSAMELIYLEGALIRGTLVDGVAGILDIALLTLLLMACINVMRKGGGDSLLLQAAQRHIKTVAEAEFAMVLVVLFLSTVMVINAPPILAAGVAFVRPLGEKFLLHPYRRANLLDAVACTLVYSLPWAPAVLVARNLSLQAHNTFGAAVPPLLANELSLQVFYCFALLLVILISVLSGWGRKFIEENDR